MKTKSPAVLLLYPLRQGSCWGPLARVPCEVALCSAGLHPVPPPTGPHSLGHSGSLEAILVKWTEADEEGWLLIAFQLFF